MKLSGDDWQVVQCIMENNDSNNDDNSKNNYDKNHDTDKNNDSDSKNNNNNEAQEILCMDCTNYP